MSCDEWQKIRDIQRKVKALDNGQDALQSDMQNGFNRVADALERIEQQITVLEQGIVDPDGSAVDALRKKHDIGKRRPVSPITSLKKRG